VPLSSPVTAPPTRAFPVEDAALEALATEERRSGDLRGGDSLRTESGRAAHPGERAAFFTASSNTSSWPRLRRDAFRLA